MGDAANRLANDLRISRALARRAIVAKLLLEEAASVCDAYWRASIPPVTLRCKEPDTQAPWGCGVPADFWRMSHAEHFPLDPGGGKTPSGPWAVWFGESTNFHTEIDLTGYTAATRYPEFIDLAKYGSTPIRLIWSACDVQLHLMDLNRLIEGGAQPFSSLFRRAERRESARWGNLSKSDSIRLLARVVAQFLTLEDQHLIATNPPELINRLRTIAETASEEASLDDHMLQKLAEMIAEEADKFVCLHDSLGPPTEC